MNQELKDALIAGGEKYGLNPLDVATAISYETGGTFDPWKKGPTTQWGQHRGLIQWGEPQRKQYGISQDTSITDQVGAVFKYLSDRGVKSGDGLLPIYAAINGGNVHAVNASDANNGGAPGTVTDKVNYQMEGHKRNAEALLGGTYREAPRSTDAAPSMPTVGPQSADIGVTSVETPAWQVATPRAPDADTSEQPSTWQLMSDAYHTEQTLPWLLYRDTKFQPDPNWSMDTNRLKQDMAARGIPESSIEHYSDRLSSVSEADYQDNLGRVKDDFDRHKRLSDAGMTGTALQLANQILDPVALAADITASAVAPELVLGRRAARVASVLSNAVAGAAGGAASAGVAAAVNPNRDAMDMLYGSVMGFGVGGAVGKLMHNTAAVPEALQFQRAAQNAVASYENSGAVGAARVPQQHKFMEEEGLGLLDDRDFDKTFAGSIRPDLSARLQQSKNVVTKAGAGLVQDGTGKANGALNPIAASEDMTRLHSEMIVSEARTYDVQLKDFATRQQGNSGQIEREFNKQVDAYIRDRRPGRADRYDPAVIKAGDKQAKLYAEALKLQQNPFYREGLEGRPVMGATEIPNDAHYAPRYWEADRIIRAGQEYEKGTIEQLIGKSMRSANPALEEAVVASTSKAFTRAIMNRANGLEDLASHSLSTDKLTTLIDLLKDEYGLAAKDAEYLKNTFRSPKKDTGRDAPNKHRLFLDEQARLDNPKRIDGTFDEQGLAISDLISTDARLNFSRYMRGTMGRVALSRYRFKDNSTGELLINGFTNDAEFNQYLALVRKKNADLVGEGKITKEAGEHDIERLQFAYSSILGRPTNEFEKTSAGWWLRAIRKYNFARIMNQVGFAQLAEIGSPIASLGFKAALSQAPALRRAISADGETILQSGLADDLETLIGVGVDRLKGTADYRMDELAGIHQEPSGSWRNTADRFLDKANRVTSEISGLTQANVMLERWTGAAIVQKFANMAAKGGKGMSAKRLADLGLDEQMTKRIMDMFNADGNMQYAKGIITGRKVVRAHFDNWSDKEARQAFISAAHRLANQIIQKNDIGNMVKWMSHPLAKALMQFRTFMVGAYGKQTLKALNMRDMEATAHLLMTAGFGGAAYVAQMKIQAIGKDDGGKFLEERLTPGAIAAASFSRAGPSSVIPMLLDTGLVTARQNPWFSYSRTTGQASDAYLGNPTSGGVDDIFKALSAVKGLTEDREISQDEVKNLIRPIMFGNSLPVVMGLNHFISDMPQHAPRN